MPYESSQSRAKKNRCQRCLKGTYIRDIEDRIDLPVCINCGFRPLTDYERMVATTFMVKYASRTRYQGSISMAGERKLRGFKK